MLKHAVRGGFLVAATGFGIKAYEKRSSDDLIDDYIRRNYNQDDGSQPSPLVSKVSHHRHVQDHHVQDRHVQVDHAVKSSEAFIRTFMARKLVPGVVVGVSHNGREVWIQGFGYANIEQLSPIHPESVMRIASISKPITMLLVAKLVEEGRLDLDKPISEYLDVSKWPVKRWEGKEVIITLRQLVSHLGGIRHYKKQKSVATVPKRADPEAVGKRSWLSLSSDPEKEPGTESDPSGCKSEKEPGTESDPSGCKSEKEPGTGTGTGEFDASEYYLRRRFKDVYESLQLFKDDDLIAEPGTRYEYTTMGWTLVSAVIESVLAEGKDFGNYLVKEILHDQLGMKDTFLDEHEPIIRNRVNYYVRADQRAQVQVSSSAPKSVILNAPYVDNSYKWAGGGLLSNIPDLLKFGNIMMYSFLGSDPSTGLKGYLKQDTVEEMWRPNEKTGKNEE